MSFESDAKQELDYFLSEKKWFLVAAFIGLVTKTSAPVLKKCETEIIQRKPTYVILSLHDVDDIQQGGIQAFVQLQSETRKIAQLRVCFIKPDLRKMLLEKGAIRAEEIAANLKDALQGFGNPEKG